MHDVDPADGQARRDRNSLHYTVLHRGVSLKGKTIAETARSGERAELGSRTVGLVFEEGELAFTGNQKIQLGPLREAAEARMASQGIEIDGHRYRASASEG